MSNVLTKIIEHKRGHVSELQSRYPANTLNPLPSTRSLFDALKAEGTQYLLECKKASPSKGLIRANFDLDEIGPIYQRYASAVSVLTDEHFFQGHFENLPKVRKHVDKPLLCKDFFIDTFQIDLAAHFGADAILLMLSVLDDNQYQSLAAHAAKYHLDILTEVSNQEELERAISLDAKIVGINNRNLRDLSTDLAATERFAPHIPTDRVIISESGIYTHEDVTRLSPLVDGFLVGSSLMAEEDLAAACKNMQYGKQKVCGLTNVDNAQMVSDSGATYGGLIFYPKSKRAVSFSQALDITQSVTGLKFIGVFVNEYPRTVAECAQRLNLYAVQLHGNEDSQYIAALKPMLPKGCKIIKAAAVNDTLPKGFDTLLLDSKTALAHGGTGLTFDWSQVQGDKSQIFLAGGLSGANVAQAYKQGFRQFDFNSALESAPGIKDKQQVEHAFLQLKNL